MILALSYFDTDLEDICRSVHINQIIEKSKRSTDLELEWRLLPGVLCLSVDEQKVELD